MPGGKGRSRRKPIGYAGLAVVVAVVIRCPLLHLRLSSAASATNGRTATVQRGTVQSSVSASGNVSAATSASENFDSSGTLTSVDVTVGDTVKAGQLLATIDPASAQADWTWPGPVVGLADRPG